MDPVLITTKPTLIKAEQIRTTLDLPFSKQHVVIIRGNGRDKRLALLAAGAGADGMRIADALAARLCFFFPPSDAPRPTEYVIAEGKQLRLEEMDSLDLDDSMRLTEEIGKILNPLKAGAIVPATLAEATAEEPEQAEAPTPPAPPAP